MRWLIYGASGYSGKLIASHAKDMGLDFAIGGRRPAAMIPLGKELNCDVELFDLTDTDTVAAHLKSYDAVLHCAGPFSQTSGPMFQACLKTGTHYLNITGEIEVFESLFAKCDAAKEAGICVIPGVGFDVVPTDAVAGLLAEKLPQATHLTLAFRPSKAQLSHGTAKTALEKLGSGSRIRAAGRIKRIGSTSDVTQIKYDPEEEKTSTSLAIPWGDVATAFHHTGIPNIKVYTAVSRKQLTAMRLGSWLSPLLMLPGIKRLLERASLPQGGPDAATRDQGHVWVYGEASDGFRSVTCRLRTPEGYHFTKLAAVEAMLRLGLSDLKPGIYTPVQAFGSGFVSALPGVGEFLWEEPPPMEIEVPKDPSRISMEAVEVPDDGPTIH